MISRESEHKSLFHEIQTLSEVGSFDWDIETNELHWSDHLFRIYGLEPSSEPIRLVDFVDRLHPDDRDATWQGIQVAINETGSLKQEERIIREDGAVRLLESRGLVIRDDAGNPIRFLGTCRDITATREVENALQWQIDGLALLSDVGKELLDKAATTDDWEGLLHRVAAHLNCDTFAGFRVDKNRMTLLVHGGLDPDFAEQIFETGMAEFPCGVCALSGEVIYLTAEQLEVKPIGRGLFERGIRVYVCAPLVEVDEIIGTLAFASKERDSFTQRELDFVRATSDIFSAAKSRRRADVELKASEARCQLVVDHAKIVIWESDRDMDQFSYVTASSQALLGFNEQQWREPGFWARQICKSDQQTAISACRKAAEIGKDYRQEYRMVRSDGETIWVEHVAKVISDRNQVVGLRGALVDITDRKLLEGQYLQAQKMEAVGTLTGGIAHDFNNLLTVIVANLENAKHATRQVSAESESIVESVNDALAAAERAAATVRQLLAFSRRDNSDKKPTDCNQVVQSAARLLSQAMDSSIRIDVNLCQDLPFVKGNESQLEHVVVNLCNNSRDAMPAGGAIQLSTFVRSNDHGEPMVVLSVRDKGTGMNEETRARMFEPFYTTKGADHGTGLGLAMCYAVVKQHAGDIHCESQLGEGTVFEIVLPSVQPSLPGQATTVEASGKSLFDSRMIVLVVDDEEFVLKAVTGLLSSHGASPLQARSGEEALQLLKSQPALTVDAVLLDRTMPGMDGWQTLQELSRLRPELPVILCSGYLSDDKQRVGEATPAAVLQKPFSATDLYNVLNEVIDSPRAR